MRDINILLGVTGGIAAYKSADLCRMLKKSGASVQVVMSEAACRFITPLTMETLSGNPVHVKMFDPGRSGVAHVALGDEADLFVVAPATADFLARAAAGRAADLIAAVTLAYSGPVLAAPAMNTNMWQNKATMRNIRTLKEEHGWSFVDPGEGDLACGWTGPGRMAEPAEIFDRIEAMGTRDLEGLRFLVTAGPTLEDLDPVRFLSNRSSGRMGFAVAEIASQRGAEVLLVTGPTALVPPRRAEVVKVRSALEMQRVVTEKVGDCDAVIMAAAVADFRPEEKSDHKLKKDRDENERVLRLVRNPDILGELGAKFKGLDRPVLVGFALETEGLVAAAKKKLETKAVNIIAANLAVHGLEGDDNQATLLDDSGLEEETGPISKTSLAWKIIDLVRGRVGH